MTHKLRCPSSIGARFPARVLAHTDYDSRALAFRDYLTIYIIIGVFYEERDLVKVLGDGYLRYKEETSIVFPIKWLSRK